MGKTKIMYEYKRKTLKDGNVTCVMIIPPDMSSVQDDKIFYKPDLIKIPPVTASFSNNDASKTKQEDDLATSRAVAEGIFLELDDILNGLLHGKENNDASVSEKEVPKIALLFDQVCRNSLRSYRTSWTSLADQSFLEHIFESGIAFYVFPGCPIIDMVVPLRVRKGSNENETEYIPMFVSMKCTQKLSDQTMANDCRDMKTMAVSSGLPKAFCLLISFGSDEGDPIPEPDTQSKAEKAKRARKTKSGKKSNPNHSLILRTMN